MRKSLVLLIALAFVICTGFTFSNGSPIHASYGLLEAISPDTTDHCGTISSNETWSTTGNVHRITCDVTVNPGVTLTINPGVVVKLNAWDTNIIVQGTLRVLGTSANPAYFTSIKDDTIGGDTNGDGASSMPSRGDWNAIEFQDSSNDASSLIDYAVIRYGGYEGSIDNGGINLTSASPTIQNSILKNNEYAGIKTNNSSPVLKCNSILSNGEYGIFNGTPSNVVDATYIWWGAKSGPYHPSKNPTGAGNQVSDGVNFKPWLTAPCTPLGDFTKSTPTNGSVDQLRSPTLTWQSSSNATGYKFCIDKLDNDKCDSDWVSTGQGLKVTLSGLTPGATYYWQVKAANASNVQYANSGEWWSFSVKPKPQAFTKTSPANGVVDQSINLTLSWGTSLIAESYEYCIDTENDNACNTEWISIGTAKSVALTGLSSNQKYFWQVRARNTSGKTSADGGTWWTFTTINLKPKSFSLLTPVNKASNQSTSLILSWATSQGAVSYDYCIDKTNDTVCDTGWITTGSNTSVQLSGLKAGKTFYWLVRAKNTYGKTKANNGVWWSFSTVPVP